MFNKKYTVQYVQYVCSQTGFELKNESNQQILHFHLQELYYRYCMLQRLKASALFGVLEGGFQRQDRVFSAKETAKRPVAGTYIILIMSTFYHSLCCLCPYIIDLSDR